MYGVSVPTPRKYHFNVEEVWGRHELRPLRQPGTPVS